MSQFLFYPSVHEFIEILSSKGRRFTTRRRLRANTLKIQPQEVFVKPDAYFFSLFFRSAGA